MQVELGSYVLPGKPLQVQGRGQRELHCEKRKPGPVEECGRIPTPGATTEREPWPAVSIFLPRGAQFFP